MTTLSDKALGAVLSVGLLLGLSGCQQTEIDVGPNWDALSRLDPAQSGFDITGKASTPVKLGERIEFEVTTPEPGRVWVLSIDGDDKLDLIYPNAMQRDNQVKAGDTVRIPPEGADWGIEAVEPTGKNLVAFLVTETDVDLERALDDARDERDGEVVMQAIADRRYWGGMTQVVEIEAP